MSLLSIDAFFNIGQDMTKLYSQLCLLLNDPLLPPGEFVSCREEHGPTFQSPPMGFYYGFTTPYKTLTTSSILLVARETSIACLVDQYLRFTPNITNMIYDSAILSLRTKIIPLTSSLRPVLQPYQVDRTPLSFRKIIVLVSRS